MNSVSLALMVLLICGLLLLPQVEAGSTCDSLEEPNDPSIDDAQALTRTRRHQQLARPYELPEISACEATHLIPEDVNDQRQCPVTTHIKSCGSEHLTYRTIDGHCNNLKNPDWGRSFQPPKRLLRAQYGDATTYFPRDRSVTGNQLHSARYVSRYVTPEKSFHSGHSVMNMAWGQFIDHDFTGFPVIKKNGTAIKCCVDNLEPSMLARNNGPCFPIPIDKNDDFFIGKTCMEFVRSGAAEDEEGNPLEPREQINGLTSYIDASTVYGSTEDVNKLLRAPGGKLKVTANNMLPPSNKTNCKIVDNSTDYCLLAGDHRVNVFVGLQIFHTVFHRLHNQLVDALMKLNPNWSDERKYEEARKIVAALHQHLTYNEYLPSILNNETMTNYRLWPGYYRYNESARADMSNVFSTAAFRFGHSQVQDIVIVGKDHLKLEDTLMRPHWSLLRFDEVLTGLAEGLSEDVDNFFVEGITDKMFENKAMNDGMDLVALNVQRGRDHGLPSYNEYRKYCGLAPVTSFNSKEFHRTEELSHVYDSVEDIDVFIGGVLERKMVNSLVGPLFACLIGEQFQDMKFGDRFFYETRRWRERFTTDQLGEIKAQTVTSVLCSTTGVKQLQRNGMYAHHPENNPVVDCSDTPRIDLGYWADAS